MYRMPVDLRSDDWDAAAGIEPVVLFEDLPDGWVCPVCGAGKEDFVKQE